jgi:hypothetical protein
MFSNFMEKNDLKILHVLRAKGASRHARARHLTSNFSKYFGGTPGPPPAGGVYPLPLCLVSRIFFQALATPLEFILQFKFKL